MGKHIERDAAGRPLERECKVFGAAESTLLKRLGKLGATLDFDGTVDNVKYGVVRSGKPLGFSGTGITGRVRTYASADAPDRHIASVKLRRLQDPYFKIRPEIEEPAPSYDAARKKLEARLRVEFDAAGARSDLADHVTEVRRVRKSRASFTVSDDDFDARVMLDNITRASALTPNGSDNPHWEDVAIDEDNMLSHYVEIEGASEKDITRAAKALDLTKRLRFSRNYALAGRRLSALSEGEIISVFRTLPEITG